MLEHYEALLTLYGRHNGVRIARKHLGWYARGIDGAADFRARMNGEDDPARVVAMIRALFAPVLDGALESAPRSEEHTSELQSLMRISYDVFCLKKKNIQSTTKHT